MAEGEFALVREHLESALSQPSIGWIAFGDHEVYNLLVDTAVQQRDEASLRKYAPLAEELATFYDHRLNLAVAHRAWGVAHRLAGQHDEAEFRLNHALEIFQHSNTLWQIGRTLFELGELALARTESSVARNHLTSALSTFESMGALPDAARTRERLESL